MPGLIHDFSSVEDNDHVTKDQKNEHKDQAKLKKVKPLESISAKVRHK
jgi:hypothetical protein